MSPSDPRGTVAVGKHTSRLGEILYFHRWKASSTSLRKKADVSLEPRVSFIINDDDATIRATLQGVWVMQHMDFAVQDYLDEGRLIRVLADWCKPFPGFYLYVPTREHMPSKVRAFMDFLKEKNELLAKRLHRS